MPSTALLATCLVDQIMPEIGVATVRLLRRAGEEIEFPAAQTCCGQPFFNSGYRDEAVRLAKRTIQIFEPYEAVVLPSGSCAAMLRVEYPHLLSAEPDWKDRASALAGKTYELSEYLEGIDWVPSRLAEKAAATYHDSCHMCRLLGLKKPPRNALELTGLAISEMVEPDLCCGFGGLFSLKMPEVSAAMTREKLRQAVETGAEMMVTADPGCLMQLRQLGNGTGLRIEHLAVILEERTR